MSNKSEYETVICPGCCETIVDMKCYRCKASFLTSSHFIRAEKKRVKPDMIPAYIRKPRKK